MTHPVYSDVFLDHFRNPRNVGELPPPAITVEVSNPVCGDILRLSAQWENGVVSAAGYKARGCTACVAAGSALTELIVGKRREQIAMLSTQDVEQAAGGLIPESKHVAVLCLDALKALCAR